jgi:hypothetical protein
MKKHNNLLKAHGTTPAISLGKFIPNTNKRYTITEDGIVYSNYRYANNGKKIFNRREIRRYLNNEKNKTLAVSLQFGKYSLTNKMKTICLNTLMEKCFSLTPPDKFHLYDLRFKDGNCFNSALSNLEYRIRTNVSSNHKHYPQPFYNLNGKITHKVCGECGDKKEIKNFNLQKPKEEWQNKTYRNVCEPCRSKIQWAKISSDIKRLKRHIVKTKRWAESKEGKRYFEVYRKNRSKYEYENLTPRYLALSLGMNKLGMNKKDLTPELISLARKRILLTRAIKQQKNEKTNQNN